MSKLRKVVLTASIVVLSGFSAAPGARSPVPQGPPEGTPGAAVFRAVHADQSPALRDIPPVLEELAGARAVHAPKAIKGGRVPTSPVQQDPALQASLPAVSLPAPSVNFDGVNNKDGVLPPDVNGDVSETHYVQWVNLSFAIYDKSGQQVYPLPAGSVARGNTLFAGFGGPCETENDGDPIVLYDERAQRWLMSQFALPNYPSGPFYQCVAVSTTSDPTGAYTRYAFSFSKMNDYPKFGVWPDGYYLAINQFAAGSGTWAGQGVAVFERAKMIAGDTSARMIYRDMASDGSLGGMLPTDLDLAGTQAPPAGAPNLFIQFDDGPDQLQVWQFAANWTTPAASTFTKVATLPTAALDSNMCGYTRACIPQPGTTAKLDAISDRLMYRLQYRNFGTHQSWVVNHTVDVDGTDRAGVRWYELRSTGGAPSIHQQGTFSPDSADRWMASAAMDKSGNIAIAYNVSSSAISPSVRYTARSAGDPLGQMTGGEQDIFVGSGSQTSTYSRWGDYSMLAVDPSDGCTFWATLEYMASTGTAPWRTRVAAFKLSGCGAPAPAPPAAPSNLVATATSSSQIALSWTDNASNESGFKVERCQGAGCTSFAQLTMVSAGVAGYTDATVSGSTSYSYRVRAYNAGGDSDYSNTASATTPAPPAAPPAAPTRLKASATTGRITLTWTDNSNNETAFRVERCVGGTCTNFAEIGSTAANVATYSDTTVARGTTYRYRVSACAASACSAYSNIASAKAR